MSIQHNLKISQWNSRSAISNKGSLMHYLNNKSIDILLISETWFKKDISYHFKNYNLVRKDRNDGFGGVAILIHNSITFSELNLNSNFNTEIEVCGVTIKYKTKDLNILSIYRPPKSKSSINDWTNIFSQVNNSAIIGGDFNAHHTIWGSSYNDTVGTQLINTADDLNLIVINNGEPTVLTRPDQNSSAIDVTFVTPDIANKIHWYIHSDTLGSNHFIINMEILDSTTTEEFIPRSKWNIRKANWNLYTTSVENFFNSVYEMDSTSDKYCFLIDSMNHAAHISIPQYKTFKNKIRCSPPWWNTECDTIIKERQEALTEYKKNANFNNYIKCQASMAKTKKNLKLIAKKSWKDFVSSLNKNTPTTTLWKQARKLNRKSIPNAYNLDNTLEDEIFDKIAPPSVKPPNTHNYIPEKQSHFLLEPFNITELEYVLKNRNNTSPGFDNIKYPMIQHLPKIAKLLMLDIFNCVISNKSVIDQFHDVIVLPILKPGKNSNLAQSYRPISLMSCMLKTLERMIKHRLEWWVEKNKLLPDFQFGYKKGYGTLDALSTLVTDIQNTFSNNTYLPTICLDIESAYDNVSLDILREKLIKHFHIPPQLAEALYNFYSCRKIYLRTNYNKLIGPRYNNLGLPQGSVLSPLLFNMYTADLHKVPTDIFKFQIIQYADDFLLYSQAKTYDNSVQTLGRIQCCVNLWFNQNGFEIAQNKSTVCIFTRHNIPKIENLKLNGYDYAFASSIKYLGMILDRKLTWKLHIDFMINRCNKGLNFLKSVSRIWWGADVETSLLFYRSYIRSIIDYGSILYGSASKHILNKVDVVQNLGLRICLGAMKSTPNKALHVEALEIPLNYRRKYLSQKFLMKIRYLNIGLYQNINKLNVADLTNKYWKLKNSPPLCEAFRDLLNFDCDYNMIDSFGLEDFHSFLHTVKLVKPSYHENSNISSNILRTFLDNWPDSINIYTDASKTLVGTGCAFSYLLLKQKKYLS
ncbi:probable RNA-directed DNA polymerase from transposon BS isoform X1 [Diabrotica virgifera virgifera]|uniref:Reverse transcriptase domain-containing protein n=1 Tax=Diabrotica virgifera virgifera TaxID=50390 RepID=A0ABM5JLL8_DIAVI|nr:probable RNA-directed DNA polymerase from transposon BS isoform X1 [Diabrotica virgifera virgifera]